MTNTHNTDSLVVADFRALASKSKAYESATAKIMDHLAEVGVTVDSIKGNGRHYPNFLEGVARAVLTASQYTAFADETLATRAKGKLTARGKAKAAVASRASKVRAMYAAHIKAGAATHGKPEPRKTFDQTVAVQLDAWVKRIIRDKDKDTFRCECDPVELLAAFKTVMKVLK